MAVGLAAELEESHNIEIELIEGGKGIFDVKADDQLIFSKYSLDRFPYLGEVSEILSEQPYCMKNE